MKWSAAGILAACVYVCFFQEGWARPRWLIYEYVLALCEHVLMAEKLLRSTEILQYARLNISSGRSQYARWCTLPIYMYYTLLSYPAGSVSQLNGICTSGLHMARTARWVRARIYINQIIFA